MNSRRDFFRQFIGQMGILRDEFHGVGCIPLTRLNELPDNIIEQIEPVFFPDEAWHLEKNFMFLQGRKEGESIWIEMTDIEEKALDFFRKGRTLKQTAEEIKKTAGLSINDIYQSVKSFFLKLASLHICHPREVWNIDELLKSDS